jgi:hypothetical protein
MRRGEQCRHMDIRSPTVQYLFKFRRVRQPGGRGLRRKQNVEITKALAALQPLYGKDNVEIVTVEGQRVRGVVRSMKTTQALTTPSVKMECANGEIVKIPFPSIAEIKDHNAMAKGQ